MFRRTAKLTLIVAGSLGLLPSTSAGQAVKYEVPEGAEDPPLTYHGLVPGKDKLPDVKHVLGEPDYAGRWYNYKMYYPAENRPDLIDVVHMHGNMPDSKLANIEAASIPDGYETADGIRGKLGEPEYELRMPTWQLLDYSEKGLRFALDPAGKTIGVAYVPHTYRRVPEGERRVVDLTHLRQGPQPAPAKPAAIENLQLGVSEIEITPQEQDWLPRPFEVHDPLKARMAVFTNGDLTVAFVGADLFGMGAPDVQVMRDAAAELGIDHLVFGMSHNHAAPDTIGVYGHYPAEYNQYIFKQVKSGLELALENVQPVKELRTASKELPMDGARVQGLFRNARNPGVLDPTISVIQAIGEDGKPITTMVNFACHVESLQDGARDISADFPGYMCDQIAKNGGGQPIFLNGAVGGMVSGDNKARTHESSQEMGLELAAIVQDLIEVAQPPAEGKFRVRREPLEIPMTNPGLKPLFESGLRGLHQGRVTTDMIFIELGEAQIITLPGELLPEVSFEILEHMEGFPRILVGLANDQLGYIIPPYDFRDDYYEETVSMGPAAAPQVRDMAIRLLEDIE